MKLTKIDFDKIESYKMGIAQKAVMEFIDSDMDFALVESETWGKNTTGRNSLKYAIISLGVENKIKVIVRNGKPYLIKVEKFNQKISE